MVTNEKSWTVFVGGVEINDNLLTFAEAEALAEQYHAEDYDDVEIAFINTWKETK